MISFEALFQSRNSNMVEHNGYTVHRYFPLLVTQRVSLKFKNISTNSPFNQAIVISFPKGFNGMVMLQGKKIKIDHSAFPKLNFWADTAPEEFVVDIEGFSGDIKICNGSDPLGTKIICKHLSAGNAMIVKQLGAKHFQFFCNDHEYDDDCDDFVFEMEIISDI